MERKHWSTFRVKKFMVCFGLNKLNHCDLLHSDIFRFANKKLNVDVTNLVWFLIEWYY